MDYFVLIKESTVAAAGVVDELVGEDQMAWLDLLPERSNRGRGQNMGAAMFLHGPDVGAEVNAAGVNGMVFAMAGQDGNLYSLYTAAGKGGRWTAEGGCYFQFITVLEDIRVIETRAADYADFYHNKDPFTVT
jgi:hypothetical protein